MARHGDGAVTVAEAARLSGLFVASAGLIIFVLGVAGTVANTGGLEWRALLAVEFFLTWPLWALAFSGAAVFGMTVRRNLTTWWDFAWRGAVASYLGIVAGTAGVLIIVEVIEGRPGGAGGFFLVVAYVIGFTVIGGPVLAGLLAALLRPKRLAPPQRGRPPEQARVEDRRRLGYLMFVAGAAVCLGLIASSALISSRGGMDYNCMVSGPVPTEPPLAVVSEASGIVEGTFSVWPLGRQCEWDGADGRGTVIANSGAWGSTAFAAGSGLLSLIGAGLVLASSPYRAMRE